MTKIETGVDRLVELIDKDKRISVEDAAKKLGISKIVIQEWADFLEEEKIISIEYRFSKTFLLQRKLTEKEVKNKEKEYSSEKDAFVRKVESSIKTLESDAFGLEKIKTEFLDIKNSLGPEIDKVRGEVNQLQKYEYLKKNLDKDIEKQVATFQQILDRSHKEIDFEQKRHQQLLETLEIEKRELEVKEHRFLSLEEKEKELMSRIQNIVELSKEIERRVSSERSTISESEKKILELESVVKDIEKNVVAKKSSIQPLLDEAKKHEEQILKLQQDILGKTRRKTEEIKSKVEEGTKFLQNFEKFFEKKAEIEAQITKTDSERKELEESFNRLKNKALAFDLSTKGNVGSSHIKELEKGLEDINQKKSGFKQDLEKLIKLIKG